MRATTSRSHSRSPSRRSGSVGGMVACHTAHMADGSGEYSNAKVIRVALSYTLLASEVRSRDRHAAINVLKDEARRTPIFVVLLQSERNHTFRGLYALHAEKMHATKIYGLGPDYVPYSDVNSFFKYNMASKTFESVPTTHFGVTTDAMALFYKKRLWYIESHEEEYVDVAEADIDQTYGAPTFSSEVKASFNIRN